MSTLVATSRHPTPAHTLPGREGRGCPASRAVSARSSCSKTGAPSLVLLSQWPKNSIGSVECGTPKESLFFALVNEWLFHHCVSLWLSCRRADKAARTRASGSVTCAQPLEMSGKHNGQVFCLQSFRLNLFKLFIVQDWDTQGW